MAINKSRNKSDPNLIKKILLYTNFQLTGRICWKLMNSTIMYLDKAIYNWKFHHHLPHLDFCWQYCHILLGYNTRIRNFWCVIVSYICHFSFRLLFYLDGMFAAEKYKVLLPQYFQIKCTKKYLKKKLKIASIIKVLLYEKVHK